MILNKLEKHFPVIISLWSAVILSSDTLDWLVIAVFAFIFFLLEEKFLYKPNLILFVSGVLCMLWKKGAGVFFVLYPITYFSAPYISGRIRRAFSFVLLLNALSSVVNEFACAAVVCVEGGLLMVLPVLYKRRAFKRSEQKSDIKDPLSRKIARGKISFEELAVIWTSQQKEKEQKEIQRNTLSLSNSFCREIYEKYTLPYVKEGWLETAENLLRYLDEAADKPSVVYGSDSFSLLAEVSLAEHTLHVVEEIYTLVKEKYRDTWLASYPHALCCAIAHDLGKASAEELSYGEHAHRSAEIFEKCAVSLSDETLKRLKEVISSHHGAVSNQDGILLLLKEADRKAREREFSAKKGEKSLWREMDVGRFLAFMIDRIKNEVIPEGNIRTPAFAIDTARGLIFINPDFFHECMKQFCEKEGIWWPELSENVVSAYLSFFKERLSPMGLLPSRYSSIFSERKYYQIYEIKTGRKTFKTAFIPFVLGAFSKHARISMHDLVRLYNNSIFSIISFL